MPRAGRRPTYVSTQYLVLQACSTRYKLVTRLLQVRIVTFQVTLHENGSLCGWWVRIWTGAGRQPAYAEECLDLFQNIMIILVRRHQSLTADSLIL